MSQMKQQQQQRQQQSQQRRLSLVMSSVMMIRLYVLVIAHPDDESMFFVPTLQNLKSQLPPPDDDNNNDNNINVMIWLVCLTSGNYDGLGDERQRELERVVNTLFHSQIDQLLWLTTTETFSNNNSNKTTTSTNCCEDHPTKQWNIPQVGQLLQDTLEQAMDQYIWSSTTNNSCAVSINYDDDDNDGGNCDAGDAAMADPRRRQQQQRLTVERISLITFDDYGVSGHVNHRDTHHTVRWLVSHWKPQQKPQIISLATNNAITLAPSLLLPSNIHIPLEAWQLESQHSLLVKYIPILFWVQLLRLWVNQLWYWLTTKTTKTTITINTSPPSSSSRCRRYYQSRSELQGNALKSDTSKTTANNNANNSTIWTMTSLQPQLNYAAMACHATQFVWYRRLFVIFSCYTYVNILRPMKMIIVEPTTKQLPQQEQRHNVEFNTPPNDGMQLQDHNKEE